MRTLATVGGLALVVVLALQTIRPDLQQAAFAIFTNTQAQCERAVAERLVIANASEMEFVEADIDADGTNDLIAKLTGEATCGSGGCIHELCVKNDSGGVEHIPFGFAAHSISVLDTTTNGMRDIMVNDEESLRLRWNGFKYELAQ